MSRVFDEKFESTGYEESWTEVEGSGSSIDEDALSSDVSSPIRWGTNCLKIINNDSVTYAYSQSGVRSILHWRVEFVLTTETMSNERYFLLAQFMNNGIGDDVGHFILFKNGVGVYSFVFQCFHDGNPTNYFSFNTPTLNTKYRFELKWDTTNDLWSWKIDGVVQPNDQDSTSPVTTEGLLTGTHATDAGLVVLGSSGVYEQHTCYYDLIAADDADWVGAESIGYSLLCESTSFSETGSDVDLIYNKKIDLESVLFNLSGSDVLLNYGSIITLDAESGSFSISGLNINFQHNKVLNIESGDFNFNGSTSNLYLNRHITNESTHLDLSGLNINFQHNKVLNIESGDFNFIGVDANLLYGSSIVLDAETGVFTEIGSDVDILYNKKLTTELGAFSLTKSDVILLHNKKIIIDSTNFDLLGYDANLIYGGSTILNAESGNFLVSAENINLLKNSIISLESYSGEFIGFDSILIYNKLIKADSVNFDLLGSDVNIRIIREYIKTIIVDSFEVNVCKKVYSIELESELTIEINEIEINLYEKIDWTIVLYPEVKNYIEQFEVYKYK